jgi:hypothetical protein
MARKLLNKGILPMARAESSGAGIESHCTEGVVTGSLVGNPLCICRHGIHPLHGRDLGQGWLTARVGETVYFPAITDCAKTRLEPSRSGTFF